MGRETRIVESAYRQSVDEHKYELKKNLISLLVSALVGLFLVIVYMYNKGAMWIDYLFWFSILLVVVVFMVVVTIRCLIQKSLYQVIENHNKYKKSLIKTTIHHIPPKQL